MSGCGFWGVQTSCYTPAPQEEDLLKPAEPARCHKPKPSERQRIGQRPQHLYHSEASDSHTDRSVPELIYGPAGFRMYQGFIKHLLEARA